MKSIHQLQSLWEWAEIAHPIISCSNYWTCLLTIVDTRLWSIWSCLLRIHSAYHWIWISGWNITTLCIPVDIDIGLKHHSCMLLTHDLMTSNLPYTDSSLLLNFNASSSLSRPITLISWHSSNRAFVWPPAPIVMSIYIWNNHRIHRIAAYCNRNIVSSLYLKAGGERYIGMDELFWW